MILHQHEAMEFGTKMSRDPLGHRGQDRSAVGRDPAFALITGRAHRNHKVLNQERLIALEARSRRNLGLDNLLIDADPRRHLTTATPLLSPAGLLRLGALVHAA